MQTLTRETTEMRSLLLMLWTFLAAYFLYLGIKPTPLPFAHPLDKLVHITGCAVLMLLPSLSLRSFRQVAACGSLLLLAGVAIEFYQSLLPARESSVLDVAADAVGIVAGIALGRCIYCHFLHSDQKEEA